MEHYAGIDVSLECSSVCVVDASGKIVREAKVASEPEALIAWFGSLGVGLERIGLEAGPLSQWLYAAMQEAGLAVELLETRHVRDAFKAMPVKTDRKDARGIAQLMRLGWFRPVHCKSLAAQEVRALLTARKLVQSKLLRRRDEPARHPARLRAEGRARRRRQSFAGTDPRAGGRPAEPGGDRRGAACGARGAAARVQRPSRSGVRQMARADARGAAVDVDAGGRRDRGADLCRGDRRSGAVQIVEAGRGAFRADAEEVSVRRDRLSPAGSARSATRRCATALYEAAHIILTRPVKGCAQLKSWAMRIARRAGMSKAKVALARKLAVVLHRMLADGATFNPSRQGGHAAAASNRRSSQVFGRATTPAFPKRGPVAGTMDQVRPQSGLSAFDDHAFRRLAGLSSSRPHQVAALRRPRTEASPRRLDDAKRD